MKAYILIQAMSQSRSPLLAGQVVAIPGVERVQPVTGPYDLVVEVESDGDGLVSRIAASMGCCTRSKLRSLPRPTPPDATTLGQRPRPWGVATANA